MRLRFTKRNLLIGLTLAAMVVFGGSLISGFGGNLVDYGLYTVATVRQQWFLRGAMPGIIADDRAAAAKADYDLYMPDYAAFGFTPQRITAGLSNDAKQPYLHMILAGSGSGMDISEFRLPAYYSPPDNCGSSDLDIPSTEPTPCRLYTTTTYGDQIYESRYDLPDASHDFYVRLGSTVISMSEVFGHDSSTGYRDRTAGQRELRRFVESMRIIKPADIPFQHHDL